ncbi:MAG: hypothetical protein ACOC1J_00380, partial [Prolixibacteraceae bacterium]
KEILKKIDENDPLSIGQDSLWSYIGKEIPFHLWPEWGYPVTLDGTNNNYWVVYLRTANISFVSYKPTNTILHIGFGRDYAMQRLKDINENRVQKLKEYFNPWQGDHIAVTRYVKMNMNDPGSFDHVETLYWDNGDHLIIQTKFRGENAYGAMVLNTIKAKVNLEGEIIEILDYY